jgi:hypothetical protein
MTNDLVRARENVAAAMEDIVRMFKPGAKIAVLVRAPGFPDRDLLMTDDDLDELIAMIRRRKAVEPSLQPTGGSILRYAMERLSGSTTLLPVVRDDGEWVKFDDVADICAANQQLRRKVPA